MASLLVHPRARPMQTHPGENQTREMLRTWEFVPDEVTV